MKHNGTIIKYGSSMILRAPSFLCQWGTLRPCCEPSPGDWQKIPEFLVLSAPPSSPPDVLFNYNTHIINRCCFVELLCLDPRRTRGLSAAGCSHKPVHTPPSASPSTQKKQGTKSQIFTEKSKKIPPSQLTFFGELSGWRYNTVTKPNFLKRQAFFFLCYLSELAGLQ